MKLDETKDGNIGGEKFLCDLQGRPQLQAATKDAHFNVLGFTTATGMPLMCCVIFAAKELEGSWVLGFDSNAAWVGDETNLEENTSGLGKQYPANGTDLYVEWGHSTNFLLCFGEWKHNC
jgi:hypothetical protein